MVDIIKKRVLVLPEVYDEVYTGGPYAVVKKMSQLDENHFEYIKIPGILERESKDGLSKTLRGLILKNGHIKPAHLAYKILKTAVKLKKYDVSRYDTIISHDPVWTYALLRFYPKIKIIGIYHGQGSFYNELTDLAGVSRSRWLSKFLLNIEKYIYLNAYKIGFPSIGAYDSLIETNGALSQILSERVKDRQIVYNGINVEELDIQHNQELENHLIKDGFNFVTVSSLNEAKGVDRVPPFLGLLKKKGIKFTWTIIGKGSLSDRIKYSIEANNITAESFLFERGFPKSEILGLFSLTDFYILFHRYSIFDLATLEAMGLGNIPILSRVGGNKEMIISNNGLLLDEPFMDIDIFLGFIENNDPSTLRKSNKDIVKNKFSDINFIESYRKFLR